MKDVMTAMDGAMNALVSDLTITDPIMTNTRDLPNRLPVKVDAAGVVWMEGKPQDCPPFLPGSSRGELVFEPADICILLGPWGPDPDSHLILSGCCSSQEGNLLTLVLDTGRALQARLPMNDSQMPRLMPRQRVWLSIPLNALHYCR